MHVLDSDVLSHLHAGHSRVVAHLQQISDIVGTTLVTKIEFIRARSEAVLKAADGKQLLAAQERLLKTESLLSQILVVRFDSAAARHFEELQRSRRLRRIGRNDLLIASIVLANDATLVTRNVRHFNKVPNLRVVNWVDS
jgi:tRNA(fMet)-specific endonuclease VapC